mmetsp:Transcript_5323/g.15505  ORF Transcript_5323/g.15505 Transcript_5323/m.15505 type:complete len:267 (-) Transcript_5323:116-916(-)
MEEAGGGLDRKKGRHRADWDDDAPRRGDVSDGGWQMGRGLPSGPKGGGKFCHRCHNRLWLGCSLPSSPKGGGRCCRRRPQTFRRARGTSTGAAGSSGSTGDEGDGAEDVGGGTQETLKKERRARWRDILKKDDEKRHGGRKQACRERTSRAGINLARPSSETEEEVVPTAAKWSDDSDDSGGTDDPPSNYGSEDTELEEEEYMYDLSAKPNPDPPCFRPGRPLSKAARNDHRSALLRLDSAKYALVFAFAAPWKTLNASATRRRRR